MKKLLFSIILTLGIAGFFGPFVMMDIFHIDYDAMIGNDTVAMLICIGSMLVIIGSCIILYRLSDRFKVILKTIGQCLAELM